MKTRFKMVLKIDTLAHATTIRNAIVSQLAGKDIFQEHSLGHYIDEDGAIIGIGEWRFNSGTDRDAVKDWIKDQVENHPQIKNWVSMARLSWHNCTHNDAEIKDCKQEQYQEWNK